MNWYLIHSKPRQEKLALHNLEQQGYECYLPVLLTEKINQGKIAIAEEPLFSRYLFIQLEKGDFSKSWSPIRSTKGVSRLVSFGIEPAKVDGQLIDALKATERTLQVRPRRIFVSGERVVFANGAFAGVEGVFDMPNGENRAMVLIEMLSKPVKISVSPTHLRKVS